MRKVFILILVLVLAGQAFAVKKTPKHKTVVYREQHVPTLGWYVTPSVKITEIQGLTRGLVGVRGGLIFNHSLYLGLAGYGVAEPDYYNWDYWDDWRYLNDHRWELGYGGLELGVLSRYSGNAQFGLGVLVGGGQIDEYYDSDRWHATDGFFIVEPSADLLFHVNRHVALGFGVGYRFVDGVETPTFVNDDLDGPSFNISLQLGSF